MWRDFRIGPTSLHTYIGVNKPRTAELVFFFITWSSRWHYGLFFFMRAFKWWNNGRQRASLHFTRWIHLAFSLSDRVKSHSCIKHVALFKGRQNFLKPGVVFRAQTWSSLPFFICLSQLLCLVIYLLFIYFNFIYFKNSLLFIRVSYSTNSVEDVI